MATQRRAGLLQLQINGEIQDAKGNSSYNLGQPKREAINRHRRRARLQGGDRRHRGRMERAQERSTLMPIAKDQLDQLCHLLRPIATRRKHGRARGGQSRRRQQEDAARAARCSRRRAGGRASSAGCEHFQPYGFFSVPFPGAEAVVIFPDGDRTHPLVVAVSDRRYRPTSGKPGEAGLRTDEGDEIRLARGHAIVLTTSGQIQLGGASAASPAVLGDKQLDAIKTLVTAIATAVSGIPGGTAAGTAINTALMAFQSAASGFFSTRVKLE